MILNLSLTRVTVSNSKQSHTHTHTHSLSISPPSLYLNSCKILFLTIIIINSGKSRKKYEVCSSIFMSLYIFISITGCGVAFFFTCRDFGGRLDEPFNTCIFLNLFLTEISSQHQFHSLDQNQLTEVLQAETTVDKCSQMGYMWVHFHDRFPHYFWTAKSSLSDFIGSKV